MTVVAVVGGVCHGAGALRPGTLLDSAEGVVNMLRGDGGTHAADFTHEALAGKTGHVKHGGQRLREELPDRWVEGLGYLTAGAEIDAVDEFNRGGEAGDDVHAAGAAGVLLRGGPGPDLGHPRKAGSRRDELVQLRDLAVDGGANAGKGVRRQFVNALDHVPADPVVVLPRGRDETRHGRGVDAVFGGCHLLLLCA